MANPSCGRTLSGCNCERGAWWIRCNCMPRVEIESLTYGPHGVARLGGKVVFVRHVAAGEEAEIEIDEDRGSFAFAHVVRLVRPSPHRRVAPCRYLPRCGGCPWQHLTYEFQLEAKQRNLTDHMQRLAKLVAPPILPPIAAPWEFHYRHRLSVRVEGRQVGFFAAASHELVPVESCLLGNDAVNKCFALANELVPRLRMRVKRMEFVADERGERRALAVEAEGGWSEEDGRVLQAWLKNTRAVAGIVARGRGWRRVWGDPTIELEVQSGVWLRVQAGVFSQVSPQGNRELVRIVLEQLEVEGGECVVDAYCGAGNFGVPLARLGAEVIAIEQDPQACADLRYNLKAQGCRARVIEAPVHVALRTLVQEKVRVDAVLLDPPRGGARETIPMLLELRPRRIVYVSCHSAALARDMTGLGTAYRLEGARLVDLFPQTYHAEVVATFVLTC